MSIAKYKCQPHGQWIDFYTVDSFSSNAVYIVARTARNTWGCSCPQWIYHRTEKGDCKHIKAVQSDLQAQAQRRFSIPVVLDITPAAKKALSRFSMVEVD